MKVILFIIMITVIANSADDTAMGSFYANNNSLGAFLDASGAKILNIINQSNVCAHNLKIQTNVTYNF